MRQLVLLSLLLHAIYPQDLTDNEFIGALLGDVTNTPSPTNPQNSLSDADLNKPRPKCKDVNDTAALSDDAFLDALMGGCDPSQLQEVARCERDEFVCTPYFHCAEENIVSDQQGAFDIRIGLQQFEEDFSALTHSECARFGDVCCTQPQEPPPTTPLPYEPRCGRRRRDGVGARIVGFNESESQFGEFPWMAAVLRRDEVGGAEQLFFECGGSLVHPQLVLTAAHCVSAYVGVDIRLLVRLGEWDTQRETELLPHVDVDVSSMAIHPKFSEKSLRDDVALLLLAEPVQLRPHIDTLCLPDRRVDFDGAECVASGWGKSAFVGGLFQTVLKAVELPHMPRAACQRALRKTRLRKYFRLDRSFTCAGGAGQDTCTGDGGSPLACRDPRQPDVWSHVGVVSWGVGCGQHGVPGVYADVRRHVGWIAEWTERVEQQQQRDRERQEIQTPLL